MVKKDGTKFQILVTIIGFLFLLFAPSIAWMFCHDAVGDETSENRELAKMPEFGMEKISEFPSAFESFWNDHVPFRKNIREAWTWLNHAVFEDSPSEMVVLGKDQGDGARKRWLFYNGEDERSPLRDTQGITEPYSEKMKEAAVGIMRANEWILKTRGIDFYLLVIPHKEDAYREFLPDNIEIYKEKSRDEELVELLQENFDNVIYAKDEIMGAKEVGQLYYRDDTHWNALGAFYGFKAFMNRAFPGFKDFSYDVEWSDWQVRDFDLPKLMNVQGYYMDKLPTVAYKPEVVFEEKIEENVVEETNERAAIKKTVLIVGDSYRTALLPYFGKIFSKVIGVHRDNYEPGMLEKYKPDVVIGEAVERFALAGGAFPLVDMF